MNFAVVSPARLTEWGDFWRVLVWTFTRITFQVLPYDVIMHLAYLRGVVVFTLNPKIRRRHIRRLSRVFQPMSRKSIRSNARRLCGFMEMFTACNQFRN